MENDISNSLSSEQPLFENVEAITKYVASFLLDFEENPKVDEEVVNKYANSLLVGFEENPHEHGLEKFRMENHVSNPMNSDQPFSSLDEEMNFVASFLVDFEENPKVQKVLQMARVRLVELGGLLVKYLMAVLS
ncbi:hypothetical protein CRYUN_Cryun08bG0005900 [Craigia yunnanensis]